jgi:hypothetical protein
MNASQSRFLAVAVLMFASVAFGSIVYKGFVNPTLDDLGRPQLFFGVFEAY